MDYFDEELLEVKRERERQKYTTLASGMYAGEKLITFTKKKLLKSNVFLYLPDQFIVMPDEVKNMKYPYNSRPKLVLTSLDSTVNFSFNFLPVQIKEGETKTVCIQLLNALKNINPAIKARNLMDIKTEQGNEMSCFEFVGYHLDGQSYNRNFVVRLKDEMLHSTFSCNRRDEGDWIGIVDEIFLALEEEI